MLAEDAPGAGTGLAQPPRSAELSEVLIAAPRCPEGLPDPLPASSNPAPGRQRAARRRYRGVRECVCMCIYVCVCVCAVGVALARSRLLPCARSCREQTFFFLLHPLLFLSPDIDYLRLLYL